MRYSSREDQDKAAETLIREYREVASLFPAVRKVFDQFDGKCFNCRVTKALSETAGKRICAERRGAFLDFYHYASGGRCYYVARINSKDMPDGKRLDGKKLIESASECRSNLLKKAADLERISEQVDSIKDQLRQLEKMVDSIVDPLPYEARDIWNLNAHLSYR